MSTVFIVGAGASHGDEIICKRKTTGKSRPQPPLINGFFSQELFARTDYTSDEAEREFQHTFDWIRTGFPDIVKGTRVGDPAWNELNMEEVFTAVELRREFASPESTDGASLLIVRNQLVSYIALILGICTHSCYGEFSRRLVSKLDGGDSLFTLNWDLLLDEAFSAIGSKPHVNNFLTTRYGLEIGYTSAGNGLFLKLHGSLNWFICTNPKCKFYSEIRIDPDTDYCLSRASGDHAGADYFSIDLGCPHCGSATNPFIVPPLVRKPITENSTIRSVWGLARQRLQFADRLVLIGFSAAVTDFFIGWLLRSAALDRGPSMEVIVVNPLNDPKRKGHPDFAKRMNQLFPNHPNLDFRYFSELEKFI
jgi:hypothetical protein